MTFLAKARAYAHAHAPRNARARTRWVSAGLLVVGASVLAVSAGLFGCVVHQEAPAVVPHDARGGFAPAHFDAPRACTAWASAVGEGGASATSHVSFPEKNPAASCFVPVNYGAPGASRLGPGDVPNGCGYPADERSRIVATLAGEARVYESIARGEPSVLPIELACTLDPAVRAAAAATNGRTFRALAERLAKDPPPPSTPYAAVATFGYGFSAQSSSLLVPFAPAADPATCPSWVETELPLYSVNYLRAQRAADAYFAGVAPVIVVSGGAVHSRLLEAFLLDYLLTCRFKVPASAVIVDPCADHTHTNLRNTGALVVALGGRTAYVVTDDGMQSDYLEEWTAFDLIGGSIDQRSLRDFGYLLGSYRRASVGMPSGFWFTPYRFWGEPHSGLGGFTCVGPPPR